jgi:VWFA-related protein
MRVLAFISAGTVVATTALVLAAGPDSPQQTPSPPVFRAGVDHVSVDVVVNDKNNQPVTGLTAADFEIVEHGQPQTITDFRHVSIPVAHRAIDVSKPAPPPRDVATNALPSPASRLFVMVVDDMHLLESTIVPVKRVMTEFVSALSPDDEVGLVFVGHSDLSVNITRDTSRLMQAIDNTRGAFGFGLETPGTPPGTISGQYLLAGRSLAWELKSVTTALAGSGHSRRAVVLVTGGTPLDPASPTGSPEATAVSSYQLEMDDAFESARRADVPIYTLDPRGIPTPETVIRGWGARSFTSRENLQHRIVVQQDHIAEIAINTGGRAFINQSNPLGAIDEIVRENGSFYVVGYSPNPYTRDGKFHEISVKVRREGVTVRARKGYVAADDAATATVASTLDHAMGAGSSVSGLTLRSWAAPIAQSAKGMTAIVTIEVDYPATATGATHVDDTLRTSVVALGPDGEIRASESAPWHVAGSAREDGTATFALDATIDLPSKPTILRVGVASQALKQAGTTQIDIDVPNPRDDRLQLAGLVLGLVGDRTPVLGREALSAFLPFQPTASRTFPATDTLRLFARAFWGGKNSAVAVELTLTGPTTMKPRTLPITATAEAGGHFSAAIDATLPLSGLTPGDYVLDVALHPSNGKPAHRGVPLTVR